MDTLHLPKVSVIIINYNYAGYLERAFDSVRQQTYPNIEIVVVDDKSTDNSVEVIERIRADNPHVVYVGLDQNSGQSVASLRGLANSSGGYVVFLDADDELLPPCIEAHIYAHLSSRIHVAFSTVDILNHVAGQDINLSHAGFGAYVESGAGRRPFAIRRIDQAMPESWFGRREPVVAVDQLHFVMPPHVDPWVWSPASANCYRRDAVDLLLRDPGLEEIRWGTDAYLIRPLSGLLGSILIDRPLARYFIHSDNRFTKGAPLNELRIFDTRPTADHVRDMARSAVKRLMGEAAQSAHRYINPTMFFDVMRALSDCWPGPKAGEAPGEFYAQQLIANEDSLVAGFGDKFVSDIFKARLSLADQARWFSRKRLTRK